MDANVTVLTTEQQLNAYVQACNAEYTVVLGGATIVLLSTKALHLFFKRLGQPRLVSESIVGMMVGFFSIIESYLDDYFPRFLRVFSEVGILAYMFVLGMEMDPRRLWWRRLHRDSIVAYAGIASSFVIVLCVSGFALRNVLQGEVGVYAHIELALILSNTASPILTRLATDLKIGKSEIGRLVIGAGVHNDLITTLLMAAYRLLEAAFPAQDEHMGMVFNMPTFVGSVFLLLLQFGFVVMVGRRTFNYINENHSVGKPITNYHVLLAVLVVTTLCALLAFTGFNGPTNAFLIGLMMPREGRVSRMFVRRINIFLGIFHFPFFYLWVGHIAFMNGKWASSRLYPRLDTTTQFVSKFAVLFLLGTFGKAFGTVLAALKLGYQLPEVIAVGCLMNVKGNYHILCIVNNIEKGLIGISSFMEFFLSILATLLYIPSVVKAIVHRARKRQPEQQLTLQWHDPNAELRIVMCLLGPHNVPAALKIIEATRGGPLTSGLIVYAMDMVELTSKAAASLTYGEGVDAVTVTDELIIHMREQIGTALDVYLENAGDMVTIRRLLAIAPLNTMHQDVCNGARDILALLIILPFHKKQKVDGSMDDGEAQLREINRKVLSLAPCSVGILVDRGLGGADQIELAADYLHVAVVFVGGPDDLEALAYAGRLAHHPGVKLTAIRFLDEGVEHSSMAGSSVRLMTDYQRQDQEMRPDDECFAEFYELYVADGPVNYIEKYVSNGAETAATLRALESHYSLFVAGHAGRGESPLTAGMGEWQECLELGPIGDLLSASDFSQTASVLIIQQHNPQRQEEKTLDDDFSFRLPTMKIGIIIRQKVFWAKPRKPCLRHIQSGPSM